MTDKIRANFLSLYQSANENAQDLLSEAELLFENGKYARAYALAFTALEEISKSQLAADVYTGFSKAEEFWSESKDHGKKIRRMAWATNDARDYLDAEEEVNLEPNHPTPVHRMNALYTHFDGYSVQRPTEVISREDAKGIIHTVRVAFQRIWEMTDYCGHQIGTKGFLK